MKLNLAFLILGAAAQDISCRLFKINCPSSATAAASNAPTPAPTTVQTTAAPTTLAPTTTLAPATTLSQTTTGVTTTTFATASPTATSDNSSSPNTAIIASVIGGGFVVVVVLIIVGTYLYKRRDDNKFNAKLSLDPANTIPRRKTTLPFFKKKYVEPAFSGPVDLPSNYAAGPAYPSTYQPGGEQPRVAMDNTYPSYQQSAGYPTTTYASNATFSSGDYPDAAYPQQYPNPPVKQAPSEITPPF
ncbi:hypothetical protein HDV01_006349 [Terramyces sp. JEL0728]|nr:hypothetical protein HDV01_006349 [Terramyces sp. JEL0728]